LPTARTEEDVPDGIEAEPAKRESQEAARLLCAKRSREKTGHLMNEKQGGGEGGSEGGKERERSGNDTRHYGEATRLRLRWLTFRGEESTHRRGKSGGVEKEETAGGRKSDPRFDGSRRDLLGRHEEGVDNPEEEGTKRKDHFKEDYNNSREPRELAATSGFY